MDAANPFETPRTFLAHRGEYLLGFAATTVLGVLHWHEIRWLPAVALFLHIDLIGYIPGAIAFRRSGDGHIPKIFYYLYNTMHSLLTQGLVVIAWCLIAGPEWALLAVPFHLFGDRGLFGNFLKPLNLPFEPHADPAYDRLLTALGYPPRSAATPALAPTATADVH
ncbi:hypothetical protein GA0070216_13719 [Micromonospora matsumotoense]|uniref:Integral membrane protein n=1 Tax=Micromonospora matsumotoense TaxID=121616 RepID=A0A1C5AX20_9ACTN|nr:hypothetical protein [Micromonospora matsumotoense]SCF49717.1 hypothetical protein GA0070216_13719 [Micromonospora matsumotoense]